MPRSQIQSSLLSNAVRTLFDRHQVDAAGTDAPLAFVLGDRGGAWTIDDVLPVSILLGWRAPPSSWALVVVASGTARWLGPDAAAPAGATSAAPGAAAAAPGATAAAPGATAAAPAGAAAGAPAGTDAAGSAAVVVSGPGAGPGGAAATGPPLPLGLAVGMTRSGETTGRFARRSPIPLPTAAGSWTPCAATSAWSRRRRRRGRRGSWPWPGWLQSERRRAFVRRRPVAPPRVAPWPTGDSAGRRSCASTRRPASSRRGVST
jgi:hypothetical protein